MAALGLFTLSMHGDERLIDSRFNML